MVGLAGPLERAIMEVLWAAPGPLRVREMLAPVNERVEKPLAYNTAQTVAERLARKGMLTKTADGLAFRYGPTRDREEYVAELMLDVLTETSDRGAVLARFAQGVAAEDARELLEALRRRSAAGETER